MRWLLYRITCRLLQRTGWRRPTIDEGVPEWRERLEMAARRVPYGGTK